MVQSDEGKAVFTFKISFQNKRFMAEIVLIAVLVKYIASAGSEFERFAKEQSKGKRKRPAWK